MDSCQHVVCATGRAIRTATVNMLSVPPVRPYALQLSTCYLCHHIRTTTVIILSVPSVGPYVLQLSTCYLCHHIRTTTVNILSVPSVVPYALQLPAQTLRTTSECTDVHDDMRSDCIKCTENESKGAGTYCVEWTISGTD